MRMKDDNKITALFDATVKVVNDIGFASSSVSKIAKDAGVSPATIYVYYANKEELLVSTYVEIKRKMSTALLRNFDDGLPIRDILQTVWLNVFDYISDNKEYYKYAEQFSNSPFSLLVDTEAIDQYFKPVYAVLQRGIEQEILKDVSFDILAAFIFYPITVIANSRLCTDIELNEETIETAFTLAWDAIKV